MDGEILGSQILPAVPSTSKVVLSRSIFFQHLCERETQLLSASPSAPRGYLTTSALCSAFSAVRPSIAPLLGVSFHAPGGCCCKSHNLAFNILILHVTDFPLVHIDLLPSRHEAVQVSCLSDDVFFGRKDANCQSASPPVSLALCLPSSVTNADTSAQKKAERYPFLFCRL